MNKRLLNLTTSLILTLSALVSVAQIEDSGLPVKGNWGVSLDIAPFIKQVDNFNNNNTPLYTSRIANSPNAILVRYFIKDDLAIRGKFRVGYTSTHVNALVPSANNTNPIDITYLDESVKINQYNIGLFGGIEKRKTKGKAQGIVGGEMGLAFGNGFKFDYTYANPITSDNQSPQTTDFSSQLGVQNTTSSSRILSNNQGYNFSFIARGILGAEYFFFPNLSLGFEYAWGLDLSSTKDALIKEEYWDATSTSVVNRETIFKGRTSAGLDNHQLMIGINLFF
jgi:hypothetical protein